jgi:hypothetical protein
MSLAKKNTPPRCVTYNCGEKCPVCAKLREKGMSEERVEFEAKYGNRPDPEFAFEQEQWDWKLVVFSHGYAAGKRAGDRELVEALEDWAYQYPDKYLTEKYAHLLARAKEEK